MKTIITLVATIVLGLVDNVSATKYVAPKNSIIKSTNNRYALHIDSSSGKHEVRDGKNTLWSFNRKVWLDDYYVSNDGQSVLFVAWKFVKEPEVKEKNALLIYTSKGVVWKKTYADTCIPRRSKNKEIGPIGDFWRIWRDQKITQKNDVISIPLVGKKNDFTISLAKIDALKAEQKNTNPKPK